MMTKENIEIRAYIKNIESSLVGIGMELSTLLLRRDKVFKVTVGKRVFEFMPTTDEVEEENMADLADKCIFLLFTRALRKLAMGKPDAWDDILAFTAGPDPKDLQFEKYAAESYEVKDDNVEDIGTSRAAPLNIENWQVRQELTEDAKNFNPVTRRVFDEDYSEDEDMAL